MFTNPYREKCVNILEKLLPRRAVQDSTLLQAYATFHMMKEVTLSGANYATIKKTAKSPVEIHALISSKEFENARSPFASELADPRIQLRSLALIPQGINNSTQPRRKLFLNASFDPDIRSDEKKEAQKTRLYRNLIWIVYKAGFESGLYPDNIFWGEVYDPSEHTDTENEEHRIRVRTRLRKSLSREENLRILEWFHALDPETASGEEVGLLIMYFHGARNNEACGMNYGHLYRLPKYPDLPLIDLIQTTQINSSRVKAGGKTGNAPRTLLGMLPFVEFLEKRRAAIERKVAAGEFFLPEESEGKIEKLPVVCRGTSYGTRCSSKDLSVAGRKLLERIGIRNGELAELNSMLRSRLFQDADIDEKEVTTYLFRRNFATILYGLGLPLSDIQYYLGHDVEDTDTARNHYTNKDKLLAIKDKLDWHPVYAVLGRETRVDCVSSGKPCRQMKDVPGDAFRITFDQNYTNCFIDVQCAEPNDEISLKMTNEKNEPIFAVFDAKTGLDAYGKTANIRLPIWKKYQEHKIG